MPAIVVFDRSYLERRRFRTAGDLLVARLTFLLTHHRGQVHATDLELTLDSEQALPTPDQLRRRVQQNVSGLDALNDLVFVSGILEFELVLEIEFVLRVVVDVDLHLVADASVDPELKVLFELGVDSGLLAEDALLLTLLVIEARSDVGISVHAQRYVGLAKDRCEGALSSARDDDVEAESAAAALASSLFALCDEFGPVFVKVAPQHHRAIGVPVQGDRISDVEVADSLARDVPTAR